MKICGKCTALVLAMLCLVSPLAMAQEDLEEIPEMEVKFATLAPKGIGWAKHIQDILIPAIHETSEGRITQVWYWGGVMGDDEDYIKKMRIGQLSGMGASAQGMNLAIPEMQVLSLPFLFNSYEEVDHIRNVLYPTFDSYAEKHGMKLLFWVDQDFDHLFSSNWEFNDPQDFREAKFINWFGPLEGVVFETLGANAIPINVPEAPSAIRQGVVNATIAPSVWVIGTQTYTAFKFINPMRIRYSPAGLIITFQSWAQIPPRFQKQFKEERQLRAVEFCRRTRRDNKKAVQAMADYGMKVVETDPKATACLLDICKPMWYEQAGKLYPKELLDEVLFQLENFRKTQK